MKLFSLVISALVLVGCSFTETRTDTPNPPDIRKTAAIEVQAIVTEVAAQVVIELTTQAPTPIPTATPKAPLELARPYLAADGVEVTLDSLRLTRQSIITTVLISYTLKYYPG